VLDGWKQKVIKFVVYWFTTPLAPNLVVAVQVCWRGTVQNYNFIIGRYMTTTWAAQKLVLKLQ